MKGHTLHLLDALPCCGQLIPDTGSSVSGTDANGGQVGTNGGPAATGAEPCVDAGADPGTDTGGTGGDTGASGDTGGGAGGDGGGGGDVADSPKTGAKSAAGSGPKVSCAGFKNQTGITKDKNTIAHVSAISGPVPGVFEAAPQATQIGKVWGQEREGEEV